MKSGGGSCSELSSLWSEKNSFFAHFYVQPCIEYLFTILSPLYTQPFVVLYDSGFIGFPCSSQKVPFVGGLYIFVSMYTSILSHQTTAVNSSLIPEWVSPCSIICIMVVGSVTFRFCWVWLFHKRLSFHCVRSWYKSGDDKQSIHNSCRCPSTFCQLFYNCVLLSYLWSHMSHMMPISYV